MKTCVTLSMVAHLGIFAWAGSAPMPTLNEGGPTAGGVVMAELVSLPETPTPPRVKETPRESSSIDRGDPPAPSVEESAPGTGSVSAPEEASPGDGVPGKRLQMESARLAWVQKVVAKIRLYQRNAPKGFEEMVRAALALHPAGSDGSAKISFRNDPSGTVGVVILSDSPGLKSALERVGWEAAPLPSRYQIPCSGVDVSISLAGERLSVGIRII